MRIRAHRGDAPVAVDLDQIGIMRVVVGMGEEGEAGLLGLVEVEHAAEVEIDERVAVEDEEFLFEMRERIDQGAGGAAGDSFFEAADADTETGAVAEMLAHDIGAVVDEEQDVIDALVAEEFDGALEQGHTEHGRHRLGDIHPERLRKTGSFAAGQI